MTPNANVATVLGSIPASFDTVKKGCLNLLNSESDLTADSDSASKINADPDPQPWGAWLPEFETALKGGAVLGAGLLQAGQRVLIPAQ